MPNSKTKRCLIVEGGGFKTGFTSGILDAFTTNDFNPFQKIIGTSGGTVAVSYYLSQQFRGSVNAMKVLAKDKEFTNYKRTLGKKGYMNIDAIAKVAKDKAPFDLARAVKAAKKISVNFVATNRKTGKAAYLEPNQENWIDGVIASSTLPFVTKGVHKFEGKSYFDGGWSDPLPVKWAYEQGYNDILVLRTWPKGKRSKQSWADYFGSLYFKDNPALKTAFAQCYKKYNDSLDYIKSHPSDLKVYEISPKRLLESTTYSYSRQTIMADYRYGLDRGLMYLNKLKKEEKK